MKKRISKTCYLILNLRQKSAKLIRPTDSLVKKSVFKERFMKSVHAYGPFQPSLLFISINLFFHKVGTCASKLRERIEMMV